MAKPFRVTIRWGVDECSMTMKSFETKKELKCYLDGIEEGCGWLEYRVSQLVENGKVTFSDPDKE